MRITVLAIDDCPDDLDLLTRLLKGMPDWNGEILTYLRAAPALEELSTRKVDVVLVDYALGARQTGLDVFEQIRASGHHTPVILITGQGDERIAMAALRAGVADYLPKHVLNVRSLQRAIVNAVEKRALRSKMIGYRRRLKRTVVDLRARNTEIQAFYQTLAHELKTPLTSAHDFISLVVDGAAGPLNAEQLDYLRTAQRNCDQLVVYINDILDLSRMETGRLTIHREPRPIRDAVVRATSALTPAIEQKGLRLTTSIEPDLPCVSIDEPRIHQVLFNLLTNAIKFTAQGSIGVLVSRSSEDPRFIEVVVADTGRGIEKQHVERIFDRMYQVRGDDGRVLGGLGLGLSIAREIVRQHGGDIRVESTPGKGSTFCFTLPVVSEVPVAVEPPARPPFERTLAS